MFEYRVSKYDPALRDPTGRYLREEWTSYRDVGRTFDGVALTPDEYRRVENTYVSAAMAFVGEAGRPPLVVEGLEYRGRVPLPYSEGDAVAAPTLDRVIRDVLREVCWCRLEGGGVYLHFGWDFYMYVGVPHACRESCESARRSGLFVEEFRSPYRTDEN